MRGPIGLLLWSLIWGIAATGCIESSPRRVEDFNFGWKFMLLEREGQGDCVAEEALYSETYAEPDYDDSSWRALRLPHDWAVEGEFSAENPSTPGGGALPGGMGWYRKRFVTPEGVDEGRRLYVEFDGVFMNSTVYLNGHAISTRPYGYSSFSYDLTPWLKPDGEENLLAVRCDNLEQPNSRWYAGCGIYRNVRLVEVGPWHVAYTGTFVTTPEVSDERARVVAEISLEGLGRGLLRSRILSPEGRCVARCEVEVETQGASTTLQHFEVEHPERWDIDHPARYTLLTELVSEGRVVDCYTTRFGIRTFRFDVQTGFYLNERPVKLLGVCQHHDLGALGAAVHRRALERQLEILKRMGCNAIRTAHNPPTPELLDLCDSMGMLVMDEAFDMWRKAKTRYDYSRFFDEWHEKDLRDFMRRDRNHPSIVMWSVGNEIVEQWPSPEDDSHLSAEQANLMMNFRKDLPQAYAEENHPSILLAAHMAELARSIDSTRPVLTGNNEATPINNLLRSGAFDIYGFNYSHGLYDSLPKWYPGRPLLATETTSSIQSRGFYLNPSSELHINPTAWWLVYETPHHQCSAYDHSRVPWGALHEEGWLAVRDRDFMAGLFVWTGFDYLGEPTPYSWPSRSSYFGIVDLCGFEKDAYYMYQSEWTDEPVLHLFPHWNWHEGEAVDLWVYYGGADEVELLLNGRSLGRKSKSDKVLHCCWEGVAFEPGEVVAISYADGVEVARTSRRTAQEPVALRLKADRAPIAADGYDLCYVTVEAVDEAGVAHPCYSPELHFEVEGTGELVGLDNGNPADTLSLKGNRKALFGGKALAIVRSKRGERGKALLRVEGDGLQSELVIYTK